MGTLSKSNIYYKTVVEFKNDINTLKIKLSTYTKERDEWVAKSGPAALRAITYEDPKVQGGGPKHSEQWILDRISELTGYISAIESQIKEKELALGRLRYRKNTKTDKLSDLQQKVFALSFIEGLTNKEIANELGYSNQRIKNIKVEVNNLLEGAD